MAIEGQGRAAERAKTMWKLGDQPEYLGHVQARHSTTDDQAEIIAEKVVDRLGKIFKDSTQRYPWAAASTISPTSFSFASFPTATYEIGTASNEVGELKERVKILEKEVQSLSQTAHLVQEKVIVLRTLTREEAKQEIIQLFKTGETLDYGDVAERVRIDLPLVVEICNELQNEGLIG